MTGTVDTNLDVRIQTDLRGPAGSLEIELVLDTGFSNELLLPQGLPGRLGTIAAYETEVVLADGSESTMPTHRLEILWDGAWRSALAFESDGDALVGMELLRGYELRIEVRPGGAVAITPL